MHYIKILGQFKHFFLSILHQPDNSESTILLLFHRNFLLVWIAHPSHVSHRLHRMLAFGSMAPSGRTSELVSDGEIMNHGAVLV